MENNDITVIIVSFKSQDKIIPCIKSIGNNIKVLVVENSNDEKLKKKLENLFTNVECILSVENLGYGRANNLGLSKVNTKYALILNPDSMLDDKAIENFFKSIKQDLDFAIISPLVQEKQNEIKKKQNNNSLIEVDTVRGFAMFLNLEKFKDIGFFDPNFFLYLEETDLCKRLRNKNKKIFLDPTIKIIHEGGKSHDEKLNKELELSRNWHWMWSTFYYYKKHNNYFYAFIRIMPKFFSSLIKYLFFLIIFENIKKDIYLHRFLGIVSSMMLKKSFYRPNVN